MNPIPMLLVCPECGTRHIDEGPFATKPHHTHACQRCGMVWRPAVVETVGVQFLPGFKNEILETPDEGVEKYGTPALCEACFFAEAGARWSDRKHTCGLR